MKFPSIRSILFNILPALALALAPIAVPATTPAGDKPVILVLGDSLSAGFGIPVERGWVALLQRRLDAQGYGYRVVNASVSGETTGGALERLPRALKLHRPAVVVIVLGGNDGLRGLPVAEVRQNLETMLRQSRTAGATVLLAGIRIPTNYGAEYAEKFYATYQDLAKKQKVALVPFFLEPIALREDLFQADGIHPDVAAQPLLLDNLWPQLAKILTRKKP